MHFEPSKVVALNIEVVYVALWKIKPRDPSADGGERTYVFLGRQMAFGP